MKFLIIGNPIAGAGKSRKRISELSSLLESRGHQVEVYVSASAGDAHRRAARLEPDVDRLVIAGGDGTVNEVLNGLVDPGRTPMTHLATGTANMLAYDLGIPRDPAALAQVVEHGPVRRVDMGLMGDRRFLLITSVGFDSLVTETIERNGRNTLGYRGYFVPILTSLGKYEQVRLTVTVDETRRFQAAAVMVLKVRHYGGLFVFSKEAALDSGCFHVCLFPRGSVPAIVRYGLGAFLRCPSLLRDITRVTGSAVRIESDRPFPVETDGDYAGSTPVEVRLEPRAAPMIFPPEDGRR